MRPLTTMKCKIWIRLRLISLLRRIGLVPKVHYVGSSEVLPPPLTSQEEQQLLAKLSQGDYSVKTPLIERNLRLVVYIARKFENTGILIEDLVSIGSAHQAVNTFDPSNIVATYASAASKTICTSGDER